MNRVKVLSICALFMLAGLGGSAALHPGTRHFVAPPGTVMLQSPAVPQKNPANAQKNAKHPPKKLGDWLENHKNMPPDQQLKALESDPSFKKLTPERQAALRDRLTKFNQLPPEQRQRAIQRMNFIAGLSQDQRKQLRDANQQLQTLPQDRRVMVHTALRHLRKMDPQQREETMQSDRFRSTFSEQEQGILKQLAAINPPEAGAAQSTPAGQPKQ